MIYSIFIIIVTSRKEKRKDGQTLVIQLTLKQHGFQLNRSIYTWIFFNKYIGNFLEICDNVKKFFFSSFIVRILYMIYITYKICVYQLFMISIRFLSISLLVKFLGSQKLYIDFWLSRLATLITMLFKGQLYIWKKERKQEM